MLQIWCVQGASSENCLKMAVELENHGNGTPELPGGPCDATPTPVYLGASPQLEPTTALFIHISFTILT